MPRKPIVSAASDTSIIFYVRNEHFNQNFNPNSSILFYFLKNFLNEIYMPPKPLAINHRAALAIIYR